MEGSDHTRITCIQHQERHPEAVFKAIADTIEVSTSYWNHIDEIYSDIKQGDSESTDQLDQQIKNLVKIYQYTADEKLVHRTELLFHATKHFEVKNLVRSKKKWEDVTYQALLQYAKEHGEGFQPSQVKWRNHTTNDHRCNQNLQTW